MTKVTGGDWYDFRASNGIDYDEEVQQIILSNKDAENGFRKDYPDHYIILTEIIRKYILDKYGRPSILDGMKIRYSVYALDDTLILSKEIPDFIM